MNIRRKYNDLKKKHIDGYKQEVVIVDAIFEWFNDNKKIRPEHWDPDGVNIEKAKVIENEIGMKGLVDLVEKRDECRHMLGELKSQIQQIEPEVLFDVG